MTGLAGSRGFFRLARVFFRSSECRKRVSSVCFSLIETSEGRISDFHILDYTTFNSTKLAYLDTHSVKHTLKDQGQTRPEASAEHPKFQMQNCSCVLGFCSNATVLCFSMFYQRKNMGKHSFTCSTEIKCIEISIRSC